MDNYIEREEILSYPHNYPHIMKMRNFLLF